MDEIGMKVEQTGRSFPISQTISHPQSFPQKIYFILVTSNLY